MVLLRHLLGDALRRLRLRQGRTLREVSAAARVSLGYLSEVERGQKEASSELLAAICSALGTPLSQVFREVSDNFALAELQSEPVLAGAREPVLAGARGPALEAPATAGRPSAGRPSVGVVTSPSPETPRAFSAPRRPGVQLAPGRDLGPGRSGVLGGVQLPPGRTAAFDDEVARRIRDVTDMVPV